MTLLLALLVQVAPWDGCKEGSYVILRTTVGKTVTEEKRTLTAINGASATIHVEPKGGAARDETASLAATAAPAGAELKREKIVIDGVTFDCSVRTSEAFQGNKFSGSLVKMTQWVCEDAPTPNHLLREESESTQAGLVHRKSAFKLTRVKEQVKVKDRQVTCWVTESSTDEQDGAQKTADKAWFSRDVPGWLVRRETKTTTGSSTTTATTEALEFVRK